MPVEGDGCIRAISREDSRLDARAVIVADIEGEVKPVTDMDEIRLGIGSRTRVRWRTEYAEWISWCLCTNTNGRDPHSAVWDMLRPTVEVPLTVRKR